MSYLMDTHIWIWWNMQPENLSKKVITILEQADVKQPLLLSAISIWEFSKLVERGRLSISCDGQAWINEALDDPYLRVIPLSPEIAWHSTQLPKPFHHDPADQIIVATARHERVSLLSKDQLIRDYAHVKTLW